MSDQPPNQYAQLAQMLAAGATPDTLIQQAQLQRKLELANALTQQGMSPMGGTEMAGQVAIKNSPLQGIAKIAQILGGNAMANGLTRQMVESRANMVGGMTPPGMPDQATQGPTPNGGTPAAQTPMANPNMNAVTQSMASNPQPSPGALPAYDPLAGYSRQQRLAQYLSDPKAYTDKLAEAQKDMFDKMPEEYRRAMASGTDPHAASRQKNAIDLTDNTYVGNNLTSRTTGAVKGVIPTIPQGATFGSGRDANGLPTSIEMAPGATDAATAAAAAAKYGDYLGAGPKTTYDKDGIARYTDPSLVMPKPSVLGGPGGSSGQIAEAPPGTAAFGAKRAEAAAGRADQTLEAAGSAPFRLNVLQNIIDLSKKGIVTGPGQEWKNSLGAVITNNPIGASVFPQWREQVTGAQELHKFVEQNGIRAWQAAGGSGTNSQLEASQHANPSDATMFNDSLQHTAAWAKAGILAEQAKGAAQTQWMQTHPNTKESQQQFESQWSQNLRPNDYIKQTIPPVNKQGWVLHQDSKSGELGYVNPANPKQFSGIW